jgi:hypothetical protein
LNGAAPEKKFPRESEDMTMFQGMTIEELIRSVERAEQHAREQQNKKTDFSFDPVRRVEFRELVEVA